MLVGFSQHRFDCSWNLCASVGRRLTWGAFEPRCQSTSEQRVFRLRTDRIKSTKQASYPKSAEPFHLLCGLFESGLPEFESGLDWNFNCGLAYCRVSTTSLAGGCSGNCLLQVLPSGLRGGSQFALRQDCEAAVGFCASDRQCCSGAANHKVHSGAFAASSAATARRAEFEFEDWWLELLVGSPAQLPVLGVSVGIGGRGAAGWKPSSATSLCLIFGFVADCCWLEVRLSYLSYCVK